MVEAEITRSEARTTSREHILKVAYTIANQSESLSTFALQAALTAFGAGILFWLLSFSPYVFDSLKSLVFCSLALGAMCAPGILFFWVRGTLRQISKLPARVDEMKKMDPEVIKASLEPLVVATRDVWHQRVWARLLTCVEIRALLLSWREDLAQFAGMGRSVAMLVHPVTAIGVVIAAGSSIFLVFGSVLVGFWLIFRVVL